MDLLLSAFNWWNGVSKIKANLKKDENAVRFGILGAASINYLAFIDPVSTHPGARLVAVAARDYKRAHDQIDRYKVDPGCKAYGSYEALLADPDVDAVYIPLPNGLHCEWAVKAMEAGKHVLIEKPITANAQEARRVRETAKKTGKVALEAFHWRFHPATHHVKELIESGKYGHTTAIYACMRVPGGLVQKGDIRLNYDLAGGACMDLTYAFSACTHLACPSSNFLNSRIRVLETNPKLYKLDKRVDESMESRFVIEQEGKPPIQCRTKGSLTAPPLLGFIPRMWSFETYTEVELEKAKIEFDGFVIPTLGHRITTIDKETGKKSTEKVYVGGQHWGTRGQPWWTTYRYQLEAFIDRIRAKESGAEYQGPWIDLEESEKLMETIDSVYDKAGLPRRGT